MADIRFPYSATARMAGRCARGRWRVGCLATRIVSGGASRGWCRDDFLLFGVALAVADGVLLLTAHGGALAVALDVHLQNDRVVDEAIDRGKRHGGIREDGCPFAEGAI